jgi:hypothetical protein
MSKRVKLVEVCGEFCTERKHPQMAQLRKWVGEAISNGEMIVFDRKGIKMLSVSFIDELLPLFAAQVGLDRLSDFVQFEPPLESVYIEQIERGVRLRNLLR